MIIPNVTYTFPNLGKAFICWTTSFKASWRKKNVKERDPKETPKTLMPLIGVQNQMDMKTLKETPKTLMSQLGVQNQMEVKTLKETCKTLMPQIGVQNQMEVKTLMPPIGVQKPNGDKNLENNPKGNQVTQM